MTGNSRVLVRTVMQHPMGSSRIKNKNQMRKVCKKESSPRAERGGACSSVAIGL